MTRMPLSVTPPTPARLPRPRGKDAILADAAAKEAATTYTARLKAMENERRSNAPGSGDDGVGTAARDLKTWSCLVPDSALSTTCLSTYKDFAKAVTDPARCSAPANNGTAGCVMLADLKTSWSRIRPCSSTCSSSS